MNIKYWIKIFTLLNFGKIQEEKNDRIIEFCYGDFFLKENQIGPFSFGCHLKLFKHLETNNKPRSRYKQIGGCQTQGLRLGEMGEGGPPKKDCVCVSSMFSDLSLSTIHP